MRRRVRPDASPCEIRGEPRRELRRVTHALAIARDGEERGFVRSIARDMLETREPFERGGERAFLLRETEAYDTRLMRFVIEGRHRNGRDADFAR